MTTVKDAVAAHFQAIMKDKGIKANELATRSGVTPSSVYSMLDPRRKELCQSGQEALRRAGYDFR